MKSNGWQKGEEWRQKAGLRPHRSGEAMRDAARLLVFTAFFAVGCALSVAAIILLVVAFERVTQ